MKINFKIATGIVLLVGYISFANAEDGYKLWLRYAPVGDSVAKVYQSQLSQIILTNNSPVYTATKKELETGLKEMIGITPEFTDLSSNKSVLIIGTPSTNALLDIDDLKTELIGVGKEGYIIQWRKIKNINCLVIASNEPIGSLYGTFHLLRLIQTETDIRNLNIKESPKIEVRILNHWDNLDRTVERGYAGFSIWDWHKLPDYIDTRYIDYARANASIGINGTVLTNVNANAYVLTPQFIEKVAALADVFRPYGIKVYLTARFSSPIELGGLKTADPLNPDVRNWWKNKIDEIYESIPDFGGFLVKANSEGQPGPQDYKRTHADGANMFAEALGPHNGIVMWRAFVYSNEVPDDRAKQAYNEFKPLDGKFLKNVLVQIKNGAIDFQPREPFHPLFGALPNTSISLELQITQEYLGQGTQLVFLAPLFKECLDSDTYIKGKGTTVAKIVDGSIFNRKYSAFAGVSNIGTDRNWTGHLFGQANWYAFGRLAWNYDLTSEQIADEWARLTFCNQTETVDAIKNIMLLSREAAVNYMTPLGLHHQMGWDNHYGPGPWVNIGRSDWTSLYYHKADSIGIGFNRTASGSNALSQYSPEIEKEWSNLETCPEKYLLWFHHVPWTYKTKLGNILWDEMCIKYDSGVKTVREMEKSWASLEPKIDNERYNHVKSLLSIQKKEAGWWRNACLLYFQQFSKFPFPASIEQPSGNLETYKQLRFPYAPGIKPGW